MSGTSRPTGGRARCGARPRGTNLILIGLRGSGKSAVARLLARRLGWQHADTDQLIEQQTGRTIREIFERDGEAAFRTLETQLLERLSRAAAQVISVGGGAVLSTQNRRLLRQAGTCVWLSAPPEELHRRLQADPRSAARRPPLTRLPGLQELRHLLQARGPLYAATADEVVDTSGLTAAEVAQIVVERSCAEAGPPEDAR